jgi:hypothetical protein
VGTVFAALPALIVGAVPARETGSAMSLNQVLRYVGFAVGSALSATVLEAATSPGQAFPDSGGYAAIGLIGVGTCAVLAVLTAVLPGRAPAAPAEPAPAEEAADAVAPGLP